MDAAPDAGIVDLLDIVGDAIPTAGGGPRPRASRFARGPTAPVSLHAYRRPDPGHFGLIGGTLRPVPSAHRTDLVVVARPDGAGQRRWRIGPELRGGLHEPGPHLAPIMADGKRCRDVDAGRGDRPVHV